MNKPVVPAVSRQAMAVGDSVALDGGGFELRTQDASGILVSLRHTAGAVAGVGAGGARLAAKPRQTVAVCLGRGICQGPLVDSATGAGRGGGERKGVFWTFLTDIGTVWAKLSSRTSVTDMLLVIELVTSIAEAVLFHGFARAVGVGVGGAEGAVQ